MNAKLQRKIQATIDDLVLREGEGGIQVAVYHRGRLATSACAGFARFDVLAPVTPGTLFPVFSVSKGIAATVLHRLMEKSALSYDTPVAEVWPAFGQAGKVAITLRQVLNHSAGVPQMPAGIGYAELCDWGRMTEAIARLTPLWEPGTKSQYHAMTFGWIVGECACRIGGRPFNELVAEEICAPLGIDTLFIGLPASQQPLIAQLQDIAPPPPVAGASQPEAIPSWLLPLGRMMNRPDVQEACIPATNGIMSAEAIARHYAALSPSGYGGIHLLTPATIERARGASESRGSAPLLPHRWGLGYELGGLGSIYGDDATAFGHVGYGGSLGLVDRTWDIGVGITRNRLYGPDSMRRLMSAIRAELAAGG